MWGRVAIGSRSYADPCAEFYASVLALIGGGLRPGDVVLPPVIRWNVVTALKMVLERFVASPADSLLILEDDVVFSALDLDILRSSGGEYGVMSALFPARRRPFNPQIFRSVLKSKNSVDHLAGIVDVEAVPFGFALIRRAVVEGIMARNKSRPVRWGAADECFSFCEDARVLGFKIGVNCDVRVGHLVPAVPVYWNPQTEKPDFEYEHFNN